MYILRSVLLVSFLLSFRYVGSPQSVSELKVRGTTIYVGELADDLFRILKSEDMIDQEVLPDPNLPGSLQVTKRYAVDGKTLILKLCRTKTDGPYVVRSISTESNLARQSKKSDQMPGINKKTSEKNTDPNRPADATRILHSLSDFETSVFFKNHRIHKTNSWELQEGNTNNTFSISDMNGVSFEVQTRADRLDGFGIMFFDRNRLSTADLEFVYELLRYIGPPQGITQSVKDFVKKNVEKSVNQIDEAKAVSFGNFMIRAGKIVEQTVSIRRKK